VKSDGERGSDPYLALVDGAIRDGRVPPGAESDLVRGKRPPRLLEQLLAEVYFATGDVETGLSHATRAVDFGLSDVVWAEHCPLLDVARTHAAWAGLRATLAERAEDLRTTMVREGLLSA
jgi:hypothetical protein